MSMITKPEELVTCPYDDSHVILKERMQFHLAKCAHANKGKKLKVLPCPYNNTHKVLEWELNHHMAECEDRGKVETFSVGTVDTTPLFEIVPVTVPVTTESWDNLPGTTYRPKDVIYEKPVLLNLQGVTPSERKAFRAEERRRLKEYQEQENKQPATVGYVRRPKGMPKAIEMPSTLLEDFQNMSVNSASPKDSTDENPFADKEGFVVPRYSRRGRGRSGR